MALPFLYLAFVRMLQLFRFRRTDRGDLATLRPADRAVLVSLSRLMSKVRRGRFSVQPETKLCWHRDLVRRRWTYRRSPLGRPTLPAARSSWYCLAKEDPTRGYRRIHGELATMA